MMTAGRRGSSRVCASNKRHPSPSPSDTCIHIKKQEAKSLGHSSFSFPFEEINHFDKENQPRHKRTFLNVLRSFLSVSGHFTHKNITWALGAHI